MDAKISCFSKRRPTLLDQLSAIYLSIRSSCQVHGEWDSVKPDRAMVGIINKASADVNMNAVDNNGWSALHFTVLCENLKATKILIRNKCDINLQTSQHWQNIQQGATPLHVAINCNNKGLVSILCKAGADCNINSAFIVQNDTFHGRYENELQKMKRFCIYNNQSDENDIEVDFEAIDFVVSPLEHAVQKDYLNIILILVETGNCDINTQLPSGNNLLHCGVLTEVNVGRGIEFIDSLIRLGIDINLRNLEGNTALHTLILLLSKDLLDITSNIEILELLINHKELDMNVQNNNGDSYLILLVRKSLEIDSEEISILVHYVGILLNMGVNCDLTDGNGNTALHYCFLHFYKLYSIKIISMLLKNSCDKSIKNVKGQTALYDLFAEQGYNPRYNFFGQGHSRYNESHSQVVKELIQECVNPMDEDFDGITILHRAAVSQYVDVIEILLEKYPTIEPFINYKIIKIGGGKNNHFTLVGYKDLTVLQIVVGKFRGNCCAIKGLLKCGADVHINLPDRSPRETLIKQMYSGGLHSYIGHTYRIPIKVWFECVVYLLSAGAKYDVCKELEFTSLNINNFSGLFTPFETVNNMELKLLEYDVNMIKELLYLGYKFNWDYITVQASTGYRTTIFELKDTWHTLQSLCARKIRLHLQPNAWVAAKTLQLPKTIFRRHFAKYSEC